MLQWPGPYRLLERLTDVVVESPSLFEDSPKPLQFIRYEWKTWMADSPVEIATQADCIRRLRGRVLIGGLGLGVLVKAALSRRDVTAVDVLELDPDIIAMIGPHYQDPRLRIIQADALRYSPRGRAWYDVVYMDIWRDVGACNLAEMIRLRHRWVDRCGWYGAWSEDRAIVQLDEGGVMNDRSLEVFAARELRRYR